VEEQDIVYLHTGQDTVRAEEVENLLRERRIKSCGEKV